jgi:NADH:ubiquinone oxidoreductase subunit 6 (subunit J)
MQVCKTDKKKKQKTKTKQNKQTNKQKGFKPLGIVTFSAFMLKFQILSNFVLFRLVLTLLSV